MGLSEIIVIFVVAVILIGPKQLPTIMQQVTKILGQWRQIKSAIARELSVERERFIPQAPSLEQENHAKHD